MVFSKIKKSKVYKGVLIATAVVAVISILLLMASAFSIFMIACFGMWAGHAYEVVSIDDVFSSNQAVDIDVQSTTITLVGYSEDETGIEVEMTCTADIRNEIGLSKGDAYSDYIINNAYIDDKELNVDGEDYGINSLGTHKLVFNILYKAQIDTYEDYKAVQIENNIENSSISLSDQFKVEQQEDLLKKKEIIKVYDAESTFNFTSKAERNIWGKIYPICSIVAGVSVGVIVLSVMVVYIGAAVEKKRADQNALQANV